jgi:mannose-6-phosphate isomerase
MPQSNLRLETLGTSISLTVDEDASYLEKILADYYTKVEAAGRSTGLKDPLKIAILTGFSLCDELYRAREERERSVPEKEETLRRTLSLLTRFDEVMDNGSLPSPRCCYPLKNTVKHYDWGSPTWIPRLLGCENPEGEPWAELWMGAHPASPSMLSLGEREQSLAQLIAADPRRYLGEERAANFRTLPFLFKLLAAARPLSIQAHPGKEQARQGWLRENGRGIPPDAPERNYRDDNHKPEILCALSPFTALCGFRSLKEIHSLLSAYFAHAPLSLQSGVAPLCASLTDTGEGPSGFQPFLRNLFAMPASTRAELTSYALSGDSGGIDGESQDLIRSLAERYPGDSGIISPLYLNLLHLKPGQAIYLPAGILHAYLEGFGVELMANSDNVLRGGLSSKHVDPEELMRILYFHPFTPEVLEPPGGAGKSGSPGLFSYPSPCREFSLSVIENMEGPFPIGGPAIILVVSGRLRIASGEAGETWEFGPGESAFIPFGAAPAISGTYSLYAASVPAPPLPLFPDS